MKGLHFYHLDLGKGGEGGFVNCTDKWCVEHEGTKYHITKQVISGEPKPIHFNISLCDGSCDQTEDLPSSVEKEFLERIQQIQVEEPS